MKGLKILIWHVHGNYLYYLSHIGHSLFVPYSPQREGDYRGIRGGHLPWGDNVHEVPVSEVANLDLDCVIYQRPEQYVRERFEIMSDKQRELPCVYLEHDPPQPHATDTLHPVQDKKVLLVHVTPFNRLMWNSGITPSLVIDHGVVIPEGVSYSGELDRGITVVNNLKKRGRRLGLDVFEEARNQVRLDLVGMGSHELDGLGEVPNTALPLFESHYRFFFNPIRYTSLGLSVCEAMMLGMPVVGLATTEMACAVRNGISGYVDTKIDALVHGMRRLIEHPAEARAMGERAREYAMKRFSLTRFIDDWRRALHVVRGR